MNIWVSDTLNMGMGMLIVKFPKDIWVSWLLQNILFYFKVPSLAFPFSSTCFTCSNRSAVRECKGSMGARLLISTIKPVIQYLQHSKQEPHGPLQGSGNLRMCGSQTDRNTARILVFLDDLLMFYQAFGVNLMRYVLCCRGVRVY